MHVCMFNISTCIKSIQHKESYIHLWQSCRTQQVRTQDIYKEGEDFINTITLRVQFYGFYEWTDKVNQQNHSLLNSGTISKCKMKMQKSKKCQLPNGF